MRSSVIFGLLGLWLCGAAAAGEAQPPKFAVKPTAAKAGDAVKIEFAVDRETDVAVFIEDSQGKVVRHLVAGVLGPKAPAPLKPGLAQSVEWDGKADWGKPAPAGPFKVRVALGLGAKYDKLVASDPLAMGGVSGPPQLALAVGPDGTAYVVTGIGAPVVNFSGQRLLAVNRDGTYQRTLIPPPSTATGAQIKALGGVPFEVGGRTVPVITRLDRRMHTAFWSSGSVAMTPGGQFLVLSPDAWIGLVDVSGDPSPPPFVGPRMLPKFPNASFGSCDETRRASIAASSDGKYAYVQGMAPKFGFQSAPVEPWYAVYRVKLPDRSPAEPFFGDPDKPGNDESHLGKRIGGMAADGKGQLYICDPTNRRVVVVSEADGKFVGSFPADNPEMVAADKESGAIYLLKLGKENAAEVVKLSSWREPKELASIRVGGGYSCRYLAKWCFAADASAQPAVLWAFNGRDLYRFEDAGGKFGDARKIGSGWDSPVAESPGSGGFADLTVDRWREDPEIYWRAGGWARFNEKTGKLDSVGVSVHGSAGSTLLAGPDGNLYTPAWPQFLLKWDRGGKPLKWEVPFVVPSELKPYGSSYANAIFVPVCMIYMTHTHGIRADGHHFVFERKPSAPERAFKALYEYAPSGARVGGPIIWEASDNVSAPRFDQQGNIYIADVVRPPDQLVPPEFAGVTGPLNEKSSFDFEPRGVAAWYGSILKFTPKGGTIQYSRNHYAVGKMPAAYDGEPKLDPALKTVDAAAFAAGSGAFTHTTAKVTGAEWMHFGISQIFLGKCNCENTRFDVDPFGRVWYPDLGRYRVGVLDTNGNVITHFGGYGNTESCGPESPVIDPKTKTVRPRRADDPQDLKSPFAEPEIAFSYLLGVAATDKYAYMGDSLNRRLLRAKLIYAAEETCEVK
jgi:hypothetical protein